MTDHCRRLERQWIEHAFSLALDKAGSSIAARMAMIAITTSNSISVNPDLARRTGFIGDSLNPTLPHRKLSTPQKLGHSRYARLRACFEFWISDFEFRVHIAVCDERRDGSETKDSPQIGRA